MPQYISRETNGIAAADTKYAMTTLGGDSPGAITVPQGVSAITGIIHSEAQDGSAGADAVGWLELTGNGLKDGEQTVMVFGGANAGTVAGDSALRPSNKIPVLIPVQPGNTINLNAYVNDDLGNATLGITLEFA